MLNIGVMVSGGGTNLQAIIDRIEDGSLSGVRVTAVVSDREGVYALERAASHGIESAVFCKHGFPDKKERERAMTVYMKSRGVGLVVLAGFLSILSKEFIDAFDGNVINVHPSLLPAFGGDGFYGLRVHRAVLQAGVDVTGATVHYVTPETDMGPVIMQREVRVLPGDTPEMLQKRVMTEAEWEILPASIKEIAKGWNCE